LKTPRLFYGVFAVLGVYPIGNGMLLAMTPMSEWLWAQLGAKKNLDLRSIATA
jgi:hypothetical protein